MRDALAGFPLPPSLLVDAAGPELIALWDLSEPLHDLPRARTLQRALAERIGADTAARPQPGGRPALAADDPGVLIPVGGLVRNMGDTLPPVITLPLVEPSRVYPLLDLERAIAGTEPAPRKKGPRTCQPVRHAGAAVLSCGARRSCERVAGALGRGITYSTLSLVPPGRCPGARPKQVGGRVVDASGDAPDSNCEEEGSRSAMKGEPLDHDPEQLPVVRPRPVVSWRPRTAKVRPCPVCGIPRWSTSLADHLHPKCRPAGS